MVATKLAPFPDQTESATVLAIPVQGTLTGLAYASRLAIQTADPIVVYASILGDRWHTVALLAADELATLPLCDQLRIEPETAAATLLASFPLR